MSHSPDELDSPEKLALIAELQQAGIKHDPEKIIRISRLPNGQIVFLEEGKAGRRGSGLAHILEHHQADFANRLITPEQIPDLVMAGLTQGKIVGYQGSKEPRRKIYQVVFQGKVQRIAISLGNNGYIVGANPVSGS